MAFRRRNRPRTEPPAPPAGLPALLGRYRFGHGPTTTLVPALADELVAAQRAGDPYAATILRDYVDALYRATAAALGHPRVPPARTRPGPPAGRTEPGESAGLGGSGEPARRTEPRVPVGRTEPRVPVGRAEPGAPAGLGRSGAPEEPRYLLLAPAGRLVAADDPDAPAVPLLAYGRVPFNEATLVDAVRPLVHVAAAARALGRARSADEVGGPAELAAALDRAWFLLAFWLATGLGDGRLSDADCRFLDDVLDACTGLYRLAGGTAPPAFVTDLAERDVAPRRYVDEWVTDRRYATPGGTLDEGHPERRDAGIRYPVGAVLRDRLGIAPVVPADPGAAIALARRAAADGNVDTALAAVGSALDDPDRGAEARQLRYELTAERAGRELVALLAQYGVEAGSPERDRVVAIGRELAALGGTDLMRAVHDRFPAERRALARRLEALWDGIDAWRG